MCRILKKIGVAGDFYDGDTSGETVDVWQTVSSAFAKQFQGGIISDNDGSLPEYTVADIYSKRTGRKLAFERALNTLSSIENLSKEDRTAFWQSYANMLPKNGKGDTKWK
jgi:hypothetical protein